MKTTLTLTIVALAALVALVPLLPAQAPSQTQAAKDTEQALASIKSIRTTLDTARASLKQKRADLKLAETPQEQKRISAEIDGLEQTVTRLKQEIEELTTGVDLDEFNQPESQAIEFSAELEQFLRPIFAELKQVTAKPREIEELRTNRAYQSQRKEVAEKALKRIETLMKGADASLTDELQSARDTWQQRLQQATSNLTLIEIQLAEHDNSPHTFFGTVARGFRAFCETRGRNLFLALFAAGSVFLVLRLAQRLLHRLKPFRKRGHRSFGVRLVDLGYYVFSAVAAIVAALVVLYAAGDWVLLGIAILLLVGMGWTSKHALPVFYEQGKLMLNLGSVREDERLVYNGIPWTVKSLNFYSELVNPDLEGGTLRLPLKELIELHSRPFQPHELRFPSRKGDWVRLSDGTRGKVVSQTPDWVQLVLLGGARKTYPTAAFAATCPENLSCNFRVRSVFGIDYMHQAIATTEVPEILTERLAAGIAEVIPAESIISLRVEFKQAGSSSLDYEILLDVAGDSAADYERLGRAIQRICVEACNDHHWIIPFTQVTIHNAA